MMAGRGPAPKAKRQRGNAPALGDWRRLEQLDAPVLPELGDICLHEVPLATTMLWDAWRDDPVTATWNASDIALAVDTILLHAVDPVTRAGEIRIRIDNLALSPKGRRDARLLLPDEEPEEPKLASVAPIKEEWID